MTFCLLESTVAGWTSVQGRERKGLTLSPVASPKRVSFLTSEAPATGPAGKSGPFAEEGMSGSFLSQKGMCCLTGLHWVPGAPKASPICAGR